MNTKGQELSATMRHHIAAWKESGQSRSEYCKGKDFTIHKFNYWVLRVQREKTRKPREKSGLVKLKVKAPVRPDTLLTGRVPAVEVALVNGTRIAFYDSISTDLLKAFL